MLGLAARQGNPKDLNQKSQREFTEPGYINACIREKVVDGHWKRGGEWETIAHSLSRGVAHNPRGAVRLDKGKKWKTQLMGPNQGTRKRVRSGSPTYWKERADRVSFLLNGRTTGAQNGGWALAIGLVGDTWAYKEE